jgi:hypothetical protein
LIHANFRTVRTAALAFALTALAVVSALLALAPAASAAKETFATLGDIAGGTGGQFNQPRGIAVNQSGNGAAAGTFYVVDGNNNRIQQFSPAGEFVRTWGWGVRSSAPEFETCTVAEKCRKGSAGNEAGQLSNAQGIAVDQSTGNVFVANNGSRRISVFKPNGVFLGAFGWGALDGSDSLQFCTTVTGCAAPGSFPPGGGPVGGGQFGEIGGLATDDEGSLYVANRSSRRVDVFEPQLSDSVVTGVEFVRSFGWGAATGADEFEVCTASPCSAPGQTGTAPGQFNFGSPADVGVDSDGNLYALDNGNRRVQKFSPTPAPLESDLGAAALSATFANGNRIALAVQPESSHVFVIGNRQAAESQIGIVEMTSEGAAVDVHGTDFPGERAAGLAVDQPSNGDTVYFSSSAEAQHRVLALNDPALFPTAEPVTGITGTEATFGGQVVSEELESAYRFEYSTDGADWTAAADGTVPAQPGSIAVEETVGGLVPNTKYGVRLTAMRPAGSWRKSSEIVSFATPAISPTVSGGMATSVTGSSARLVAYLNPNHSATSYRFEYGTSAAYGSSTAAASAGDGSEETTVSQLVAGLAPNTTYHFRVVATNQAGEEVGPDLTFTTSSIIPAPPEGRAFELVSLADSNSQRPDASNNFEPTAASGGDAVAYMTLGPMPGSAGGGAIGNVVSRRGADGWTTDPLNPLQAPSLLGGSLLKLVSDDLSRVAIMGPSDPQPAPGGGEGTGNLFQLEPATDTFRTVSLHTPPYRLGQVIDASGGSRDLGVIVFEHNGNLLEEGNGERQLYMWTEATETIDLVGRQPETGEPMEYQTFLASLQAKNHAVSDDGSRIFFISNEEVNQIWVRIDGERSQNVSASQATVPEPRESRTEFRYAASDGSVAFFSSGEKLTDDATPGAGSEDLYRYEVDSEELTDLTVHPGGAEVLGTLGGSDDGSIVYFVARAALAPGAQAGDANVYVWRDDGSAKGSIEFIARDVEEMNYMASQGEPIEGDSPSRVTPDGSKVLFTSVESLTDYPTNGFEQAYLYDVVTDQLRCVSCNPMGGPVTADVRVTGSAELTREGHSLSDDGRRVFFTSAERLAPEDRDSGEDVYEYDTQDGQVTLLSAGTSDNPSLFLDASNNGRDVFFLSDDALVGIDRNEHADIYDARIGGGFASQNPPPAPVHCGPGECQAPTPAAPPPVPASSAVQGPGNQVQKGKRAQKPKKCRKQGKGKKKRGKRCAGKAGKRHGRR